MKPNVLSPSDENINKCIAALNAGEVVAFPTETVYGLGADATQSKAVSQIFKLKNRPFWNPLIVHIPNKEWVFKLAKMSPEEKVLIDKLIDHFWPGPLTLVLQKNPQSSISPEVFGGLETIALRLPNHPVAQNLLKSFGKPIAAPSANQFQHVSASREEHIINDFSDKNILVLNGGECEVGLESTILKIINSSELKLLRKGIIGEKEIKEALSPYIVSFSHCFSSRKHLNIEAPGQLSVHYSPKKPVYLIKDSDELSKLPKLKTYALVDYSKSCNKYKGLLKLYIDLSEEGNAEEASHSYYSVLRIIENQENVDSIIIFLPETVNSPLEALVDRMEKSAGGKYLKTVFFE